VWLTQCFKFLAEHREESPKAIMAGIADNPYQNNMAPPNSDEINEGVSQPYLFC
jgi:hypothetical protein